MPRMISRLCLPLCLLALTACGRSESRMATTYIDPGKPGAAQGVGIESQDIINMTDQMLRDMLAHPTLGNRRPAPQVIIDSAYFKNESTNRVNVNTIVDRLRVQLNRSAAGRMVFIGREYASMVEDERELKRRQVTGAGTLPTANAPKGADFRLGGRITSLDQIDPRTGVRQRFNQIVFEMVDLETSEIIWNNMYDFAKASQDDIVYR